MRFILRFMSLVALVIAVVSGVLDSIQSFSASATVLTPLGTVWQTFLPDSFDGYRVMTARFNPAADWVLDQPLFAVALVMALLFWMAGYKKPLPATRIVG
jgi:hypothetical protein